MDFFSSCLAKDSCGFRLENLFRLSRKMMVYGRAYFKGKVLSEFTDIGFSNVDEVIERLASGLPTDIPEGCAVQFRITNCDSLSVTSLSVAPLAVLPEFQRKGIGGKLIKEAHQRAALLGYGTAVILGHKEYYPRFGYRKAIDLGIDLFICI